MTAKGWGLPKGSLSLCPGEGKEERDETCPRTAESQALREQVQPGDKEPLAPGVGTCVCPFCPSMPTSSCGALDKLLNLREPHSVN